MSKKTGIAMKAMAILVSVTMVGGGIPTSAFADDGTSARDIPVLGETTDPSSVDVGTDVQIEDTDDGEATGSELPQDEDQTEEVLEVTDEPADDESADEESAEEETIEESSEDMPTADFEGEDVGQESSDDSIEEESATKDENAENNTDAGVLSAQSTSSIPSTLTIGGNATTYSTLDAGDANKALFRFGLSKPTVVKFSLNFWNIDTTSRCSDYVDVQVFGKWTDWDNGKQKSLLVGSKYTNYLATNPKVSLSCCLSAGDYELVIKRGGFKSDHPVALSYSLSSSKTELKETFYWDFETGVNYIYQGRRENGPIGIGLDKTYYGVRTSETTTPLYKVIISKAGKYTFEAFAKDYLGAMTRPTMMVYLRSAGNSDQPVSEYLVANAKASKKTVTLKKGTYYIGFESEKWQCQGQYWFKLSAAGATAKKKSVMKATTTKQDVAYDAVKVRDAFATPITVTGSKGKVKYTLVADGSSSCLTIADTSTGQVKVAKGTKPGEYKIKVKVYDPGNSTYEGGTKTVTATVGVKRENPMVVKSSTKYVKYDTLKTKSLKVTPITVTKALNPDTVKYTLACSCSSYLSINAKTGEITVKKGAKKNAYKVYALVTSSGNKTHFEGSRFVEATIIVRSPTADNPTKVTAADKSVSYATLKSKNVVVAPFTVRYKKGAVTYTRIAEDSSPKLLLNYKNGKVTVKKGTKVGKYTMKVRVTAVGNAIYKSKSWTKTVTVRVIG